MDQLTVGKDEPEYAKRGSDPRRAKFFLVASDTVQNAGPILTGKDLVHAQKGIVDVEKRDADGFAISLFWNLATKELRSKNGCQEGQKKHEKDQV